MWLTCQSNVDVLGSGVIRCKPINHTIQNPQFISTDMLPRYDAHSPDAMPPMRLHEGELNGIFSMIKRLADNVDEYSTVLSAVTRDMQLLQARCATQLPRCDQPQRQSTERSSAVANITTVQPSTSNVPDWAVIASTHSVHANKFDALR